MYRKINKNFNLIIHLIPFHINIFVFLKMFFKIVIEIKPFQETLI
jgi:hypothetical protein